MFVFSLKRYKKCLLFYTSRCHQSDLDTQQHQQQRQHRLEQQHGVECTPPGGQAGCGVSEAAAVHPPAQAGPGQHGQDTGG